MLEESHACGFASNQTFESIRRKRFNRLMGSGSVALQLDMGIQMLW